MTHTDSSKCIVLGAGLTGLTAGFISGSKIYEQTDLPGGLCLTYGILPKNGTKIFPSRINNNVFRFETGGGHWLWGSDKKALGFLSSFGQLKKYNRKVSVYLPDLDLFVPYPLQYNLWKLPRGLANKAFEDLTRASREKSESNTMSNWLTNVFGQTLCHLFFLPFNTLYTSGLLDKVAPQDSFKNPIDLVKVERGLEKMDNSLEGYNSVFLYPKATLGTLAWRIASKCDIEYNKKVSEVNLAKRQVGFSDGTSVKFENAISTIPLNAMASFANLENAKHADPYTSVLVVNIAGPKGRNCPPDQWIYFPVSRTGFHRIGIYTNVDNLFLPTKLREKNWASFYVEKSYFTKSKPSSENQQRIAYEIANELVEMGYLDPPELVSPTWVDVAYNWRMVGSNWVENSLSSLRNHNVFQVGRYAEWGKYQGMVESISSARSIISQINSK